MNPQSPGNKPLSYGIITLIIIFYMLNIFQMVQQSEEIPYSEFLQLLSDHRVEQVWIEDHKIKGQLGESDDKEIKGFSTNLVDPNLSKLLAEHGVKFQKKIENTFFRDIASWLIPFGLFFGFWFYMSKKLYSKSAGGGFMSIGKSKAKIFVQTDIQTTFDDVAGVDEAKEEILEVVNFLKDTEKYERLGGKLPKGILLVGPPGTGKTLLARATAGEAKVPFFSISGSEFVEMFVGVGAARVRDLFEQARAKAPCIIFIDELDSLGRSRMANPMGSNDEKEQTLNQLLAELDGFDSSSGIVLLAATNRPEILDPALLRSGRFDRQILVDRPDKKGRVDILKVHVKNVKIDPNFDLNSLAMLTTGFTGADLANLVNEAAIMATRRKAESVTTEDFTMALERIIAGAEKKNRILSLDERSIIAHHEMGHALMSSALCKAEKVHKVSIIPRGIGALGYTIQTPTEERFLMTKKELENKMSVLYGGRAAEEIIFNSISTGASDDIAKASNIAHSIVLNYGMDESLKNLSLEQPNQSFLGGPGQNPYNRATYSEHTARLIDDAVQSLTDDCYENAKNILNKNRALLEKSAKKLLQQETLVEAELAEFFNEIVT
ncbi:MAG: ATP-dependent zinc metalloprotease FtsH [Bacteriovoracaceae bacterium]|jgi:cell division protease FtsH|nr:ATP-dependent zinc metalloprotease FtsH [Bacteriovoracaceae bacterium]